MTRFFLIASIVAALAAPQQTTAPSLDVVPRKPADRATVAESGGKTVVTVTSASGIGGMTLNRKGDKWPTALVLHLNLHGLESIKLAAGSVSLAGFYSSHGDPNPVSWAVVSDGGRKETAIDRSSPYWTAVRAMPVQVGGFEVDVPAALLSSQSSLTVEWIDFYR